MTEIVKWGGFGSNQVIVRLYRSFVYGGTLLGDARRGIKFSLAEDVTSLNVFFDVENISIASMSVQCVFESFKPDLIDKVDISDDLFNIETPVSSWTLLPGKSTRIFLSIPFLTSSIDTSASTALIGSLKVIFFDRKHLLISQHSLPLFLSPFSSPIATDPIGPIANANTLDISKRPSSVQHKTFFKLINASADRIPINIQCEYDTLEIAVHCSKSSLNGFESLKVPISLKTFKIGRHFSKVVIHDLLNDIKITLPVLYYVGYPLLVHIPDSLNQFNFGNCYVTGKGECDKVVPIRIANSGLLDVMLSVKTNMPRQIEVYTDSSLRVTARRLLFLKHRSLLLYVRVRLSLPENRRGNGESLRVSGGIIFAVRKMSSFDQWPIQRLVKPFKAVLGESLMKICDKDGKQLNALDFGCCSGESGEHRKDIWLWNISDALPLRFSVSHPKSISTCLGSLADTSIPPKSQISIETSIVATEGLVLGSICLNNLSNASQSFLIPYQYFTDPLLVKVDLPRSPDNYFELDIGAVFVSLDDKEDGLVQVNSVDSISGTFKMTGNHMDLFFVSQSDTFSIESSEGISVSETNRVPEGYSVISNWLSLGHEHFYYSYSISSTTTFDALMYLNLSQGKRHPLYFTVLVMNSERVLQAIKVKLYLVQSLCTIVNPLIELQDLSRESSSFEMHILNSSDCTSTLHIKDIPEHILSDHSNIDIPPFTQSTISFTVSPMFRQSGASEFNITLIDPKNKSNIDSLTASIHWVHMDSTLRFSKPVLEREEQRVVEIPGLVFPAVDQIPSEEWFSLHNTAKTRDVRVSAVVEVEHGFNSMLDVQFLYRSSNIDAESCLIAAGTSEDFKVRVVPLLNRRVDELLYQGIHKIGRILFTLDTSVQETLDVYSKFVKGVGFTVEPQRLQYPLETVFKIKNVSPTEDLVYRVEADAFVSLSTTQGSLAPFATESVVVGIAADHLRVLGKSSSKGIGMMTNIQIVDLRQPKYAKMVTLAIKPFEQKEEQFPVFELRHCVQRGNSGNCWDLTVEDGSEVSLWIFNGSSKRCGFKISETGSDGKIPSLVQFTPSGDVSEGQLVGVSIEMKDGFRSTSLLVENMTNPSDINIVHVKRRLDLIVESPLSFQSGSNVNAIDFGFISCEMRSVRPFLLRNCSNTLLHCSLVPNTFSVTIGLYPSGPSVSSISLGEDESVKLFARILPEDQKEHRNDILTVRCEGYQKPLAIPIFAKVFRSLFRCTEIVYDQMKESAILSVRNTSEELLYLRPRSLSCDWECNGSSNGIIRISPDTSADLRVFLRKSQWKGVHHFSLMNKENCVDLLEIELVFSDMSYPQLVIPFDALEDCIIKCIRDCRDLFAKADCGSIDETEFYFLMGLLGSYLSDNPFSSELWDLCCLLFQTLITDEFKECPFVDEWVEAFRQLGSRGFSFQENGYESKFLLLLNSFKGPVLSKSIMSESF